MRGTAGRRQAAAPHAGTKSGARWNAGCPSSSSSVVAATAYPRVLGRRTSFFPPKLRTVNIFTSFVLLPTAYLRTIYSYFTIGFNILLQQPRTRAR